LYFSLWLYEKTPERLRFLLFCAVAALAAAASLLIYSPDLVKGAGLALGCAAGYAVERRFINFPPASSRGRRVLRYALGVALTAAAYILLKLLLPETPAADYARYAVVAFSSWRPVRMLSS
jgi:thiol:disulfide interchange protein